METALHTEKISILSRLIKESSLTLEEALLLLKEEEQELEDAKPEPYVPQTSTGTWIVNPGVHTIPNTWTTFPTYTTSSTGNMPLTGSNVTLTNTIAEMPADLNN